MKKFLLSLMISPVFVHGMSSEEQKKEQLKSFAQVFELCQHHEKSEDLVKCIRKHMAEKKGKKEDGSKPDFYPCFGDAQCCKI